ncbi:unnamed protein product [Penicillium roqueforti FM164]|uniref:Genomic scaffold, ProqFM164S01 n=1 Tax=Penicillium roqueforti (strain FM164) TaxID=1365484 RepID=W6QJ55_PENRF|nr:unnamed protein product [Penicillium roqueforti FM164]
MLPIYILISINIKYTAPRKDQDPGADAGDIQLDYKNRSVYKNTPFPTFG